MRTLLPLFRISLLVCSLILPVTGFSAILTIGQGGSFSLPSSATLVLPCADLTTQSLLNLEQSQIQMADTVTISPTGTLEAGSSLIQVGANWINQGTFHAGSSTVEFLDGCTQDPAVIQGSNQFHNLTLKSQTGRTFIIPEGSGTVVNGVLTLQGTPQTPIRLVSSGGVATIWLKEGASLNSSYVIMPSDVLIKSLPIPVPTLTGYAQMFLAILLLCVAVLFRTRINRASQSRL